MSAPSLIVPTLARMSLRATLRSRRLAVAGLVCLIPILLGGALIASDSSRAERDTYPLYLPAFQSNLVQPVAHLILAGTVPFIAMLLAGSIVADDVEDRTFSYILVRPLRRHQVYLSRLLPAAAIAAALAVLQVLAFTGMRLVSWAIYGQGTSESFGDGLAAVDLATWKVILIHGAMGMAAALLAAVAFVALFAFVTVITTRYHFLVNVLLFASIELLFGNIGGRGAGVLTITYHARSILEFGADTNSGYHAAPWGVALIALLAMTAFWTWLGARQMGRRDFNVTSAAT